MRTYLLGLLTLPTLAAVGLLALKGYWDLQCYLESRWGLAWEAKWGRKIDEISDYTLSHDIWWERAIGPVFAGGWYFEHRGPHANRWVGFGSRRGPCVMFFKKRDLTAATEGVSR